MFKKKFKSFLEENIVYLLSFFIPFILWIIVFIAAKYDPFGGNTLLTNDGTHQYYAFLSLYREKLIDMKSLLYSFSGGLGFDFYTLWVYYLASPLNFIIVLFPIGCLSAVLNMMIVVKVSFAGFAFSYYLGQHGHKKDLKVIIFSCGYALNAFIMGYDFNIMWLESIALFPIILAGVEKLLKENKWKLYTFSLFLSLWCNFYMSFMICIFLVIWFFFYEFKSVKEFFKKGIRFAIFSILSAALAAIVLIPAYIGISQLQEGSSIPAFINMYRFTDIFMADTNGGLFAFQLPVKVTTQSYLANLYCGMIVFGLALLYLINKKIKVSRKIKAVLIVIILTWSLNNAFLNWVWHGFHTQRGIPNRFSFLLMFMVLLLAYTSLRDIKVFKWWQISLSGILVVLAFFGLYYLKGSGFSIGRLMPSIVLVVGYTLIEMAINVNWFTYKVASILLIVIVGTELALNMYVANTSGEYSLTQYYRYPEDVKAAKDYMGDTLYRQELSNPSVYDEGMAYGLNGTGMFNTMAKQEIINNLGAIGYGTSASRYCYGTGTPVINTLFAIKNIVHLREDAIRLEDRYVLKNEIGEAQIYENPYVLPIGYMVNDEAMDWADLKSDVFQNQEDLLKKMTGQEYNIFDKCEYDVVESNDVRVDQITEHEYEYFGATSERKDNIVFKAAIPKDKDIYIYIEGSVRKNLQIKINDTIIADKMIINQYYHVGNVKAGDVITINIGVYTDEITYTNMYLDIYSYNRSEMDRAYSDLSTETFQTAEFNERYIKGTVTSAVDRTFFTTIPYDDAWEIKVDGQKVETKAAANAFLSIPLAAGTHTIELKYTPKGFYIGLAVSVGAVLVILLKWFIDRKRMFRKER